MTNVSPLSPNPVPSCNPISTDAAVRSPFPARRRLVLVDIENLCGGAAATPQFVAAQLDVLFDVLDHRSDDVIVIAAGPTMTVTLAAVWHGPVRLGRGRNGADHRLVECLDPNEVVGRYTAVVLASGDGRAFAAPVRRLARAGVPVDVVARRGSLGDGLLQAARGVTYFDLARTVVAA